MNVLLQTLERDGVVTRPSEARSGRVMPAQLTERGRRDLAAATAAVRGVEDRMLSDLGEDDRAAARRLLQSMVRSLRSADQTQAAADDAG